MTKGHSKLYFRNTYVATIDEGGSVNNVAFQQGDGATVYGTVVMQGLTEVIVCEWKALQDLLESQKEMDRNMDFVSRSIW